MKLILILVFCIDFIFASNSLRIEAKPEPYYDFGICGKEYNITEPDMYEIIMSSVKKFKDKMNTKEMIDEVKKQVAQKAIFNSNIPVCMNDQINDWYDDYYTYPIDIYNPMGRLIHKKGDRVLSPPIPGEKNICIIEGKNIISAKNQINFFEEKTNNNCLYIILNRDVRDFWKEKGFSSYDFFPGNEKLLKRFNVKCVPSIIRMKDVKIRTDYYSIENFKNK